MSAISVILISLCSAVISAPVSDDAQARIISYENSNDGTGNYKYSFETSNGLKKTETGTLVNAGQPDAHIVVYGEFSYIDEKGEEHLVQYTADENGYRMLAKPTTKGATMDVPIKHMPTFQGMLDISVVTAYSPALVASLLG